MIVKMTFVFCWIISILITKKNMIHQQYLYNEYYRH